MPTANPVPSQDPSDLLFNAGKLDEVLNGTGNSFTDRLGVARRTVAGMNSDFDAQLADAESDLNVYRADAAASAAEALGYLQTIRATSYGAYAGDPATDPLGNPPTVGDEYFNTTANLLKRWNGTTWQASDINTANLAASSGSSMVGYDGQTVQDVLDGAKSLQDYAALRAYIGRATRVYITGLLATAKPAGIAGVFQHDSTDTTSADNGGTIIVGTDGRRWRRDFKQTVEVQWFLNVIDGVSDNTAGVNAAAKALTSNQTLLFTPGVYVLGNATSTVGAYLSNLDNILISGYGAVIKNKTGASTTGFAIWLNGCSNITIEGLRFDRFNSDLAKKTAGTQQGGVYVQNSSKATVRDCNMYDVYHGVYIIDSPAWCVDNCRMAGLVGFSATNQTNSTIAFALAFVVDSSTHVSNHGKFVNNYTDNIYNTIYCEDGDYCIISNNTTKNGHDSQIYARGAGIVVDGNTVINAGKDGIKILSNDGGTRGVISNNVVIKPGKVKSDGGSAIVACDGNYSISGNVIELDAVANLASPLTYGIAAQGFSISVTGNTIFGGGATDNTSAIIVSFGPSYFGDQTKINITGNSVSACRYGINVFGSATYAIEKLKISANVIDGGQYGIYVGGVSSDKAKVQKLTINDNLLYDNILYAQYCKYGKISDNSIYKTGAGDGVWLLDVDVFEVTENLIHNTSGVGIRASSACTLVYGKQNRFEDVAIPYFGGGIRYDAASSMPTTGAWGVGDRVWNTSPSAGGTPGWVCVAAGTPGTWKAMANLAA